MDKYFGIVNILIFSVILVLISSMLIYLKKSDYEMMQIRINTATNNANDAALLATQLNLQVDIMGNERINPAFTYNIYRHVFMKSFNITGKMNENRVSECIPAMVLATDNGYFMRLTSENSYKYAESMDMEKYDESSYTQAFFSQKIPYARVEVSGTNKVAVSDTISGKNIIIYSQSAYPAIINYDTHPDLYNKFHNSRKIVEELVGAIGYMVDEANYDRPSWNQKFYVPSEFLHDTLYDTVTFKGITLITLLQGFDILTTTPIDTYTISGTQLVFGKQYVCYERDGKKYYCESKNVPSNVYIFKTFPTVEDAVRNKFNPDPIYYKQ